MFITVQAARTAAKWCTVTSVKYQADFLNLAGYDGNWPNWKLAQDRIFVPVLVICFSTSTDRVVYQPPHIQFGNCPCTYSSGTAHVLTSRLLAKVMPVQLNQAASDCRNQAIALKIPCSGILSAMGIFRQSRNGPRKRLDGVLRPMRRATKPC